MGLEVAAFIPELVEANPDGADPVSQGDDHIRTLKTAIKGSFPAFVGTTATPKSVAYTEDQLNDAALKSAVQTIAGKWTYTIAPIMSGGIEVANNRAITGRNVADDADLQMIFMDPNNICQVGSALSAVRVNALTSGELWNGVDRSCTWLPRADGSLLVRDMGGFDKKAGFRNPGARGATGVDAILQSDEGAIVQCDAGIVSITVNILEANTTVTILNRTDDDCTIIVGTATLEWYDGGGAFQSGNRVLKGRGVAQLHWRATSAASIWGNGLS